MYEKASYYTEPFVISNTKTFLDSPFLFGYDKDVLKFFYEFQ